MGWRHPRLSHDPTLLASHATGEVKMVFSPSSGPVGRELTTSLRVPWDAGSVILKQYRVHTSLEKHLVLHRRVGLDMTHLMTSPNGWMPQSGDPFLHYRGLALGRLGRYWTSGDEAEGGLTCLPSASPLACLACQLKVHHANGRFIAT